ncbi:MAG: hypothetical protein EOM68_26855 [Spirochaetia bacterium]|nr:hypothetical protein [Spirochaetia bacterium]
MLYEVAKAVKALIESNFNGVEFYEGQFESFDEASIAACKLGGQKFLVDLFSDSGVREALAEPQEQNFGSFEMKM